MIQLFLIFRTSKVGEIKDEKNSIFFDKDGKYNFF